MAKARLKASPLVESIVLGALLLAICSSAHAQLSNRDGLGAASSATVEQAAQQLGVTPSQLAQLRSQASQGALPSNEVERICAGAAAKHMSAADVDSIASELGLSADQIDALRACVTEGKPPAQTTQPQALAPPGEGNPSAPAIRPPSQPPSSEVSSIESSFRDLAIPSGRTASPALEALVQFGYSLFSEPVSTFAPVTNVPVGSNYILGPGDELNVLLWGRVNQTLHLQVQRDGTILMPQIGPIQVAGLTFEQTKKLVETQADHITGVEADLTMGQIRTIQVFVIGQVNHPGLYTVSALSHVSNALVAAGGVSKVGSLRQIELRRENQLAHLIDLYDMLLRGNTIGDVRLEPRDVIFVPVIGPVVAVAGDVKNPAIYELKGSENLSDVLRIAGGVGAFGYARRLQLERIDSHERRIALDIDLNQLGAQRFAIRDGDLIEVFRVLPQQMNVVTLRGNVYRPSTYQWHSGMRVADLVREGEGVRDRTFFDYALIRRLDGPSRRVHFVPLDLGAAVSGDPASNIALAPRDELTIYSENDLEDLPTVTVRGAVRRPGTYPLSEGMKVSDLVFEAGGPKEEAYLERAVLARTQVTNGTKAKHTVMDVDLRDALSDARADNLSLKRGDELFVQQASNWHPPWEVTLEGEVQRPGPYVIREGERLTSILVQSGGLRPDAYLPAVTFIRLSVKKLQQQRLDESRVRLEQEVARLSVMPGKLGEKEGDRAQGLAMMQRVLTETQGQQAVGRIVLHFTSISDVQKSPDDLVLENGDRIAIPKRPGSVNVLGQVYNPTAIVYEPPLTVRDYLERAGGPTEGADEKHIFVIKANGEVITDESVRNSGDGILFPLLPAVSGGLMRRNLGPGDTVYVPERLIYVDGFKYATDITQIVANSALSLATLGILATRL